MTPAARDALSDFLAQLLIERYEAEHPEAFAPAAVAPAPVEAQNPTACTP